MKNIKIVGAIGSVASVLAIASSIAEMNKHPEQAPLWIGLCIVMGIFLGINLLPFVSEWLDR